VKTLLQLILLIALSTLVVNGALPANVQDRMSYSQTLPEEISGFGSEESLLRYAAWNSETLNVSLYQRKVGTTGYTFNRTVTVTDLYHHTPEEIEEMTRQIVNQLAEEALTSPQVDKDRSLRIFGNTLTHLLYSGADAYYLTHSSDISFEKSSDGAYNIPDLSEKKLRLRSEIDIVLPGATWLRLEIHDTDGSTPVLVADSRGDSTVISGFATIVMNSQLIRFKTSLLTAGLSGSKRLKLYAGSAQGSSYVVKIYDTLGQPVPEAPLTLTGMKISNNQISFDVSGEVGRWGTVVWAPCLNGQWEDQAVEVVARAFGEKQCITLPIPSGSMGFYQIRANQGTAPLIQ
jgi:hypothetical protein